MKTQVNLCNGHSSAFCEFVHTQSCCVIRQLLTFYLVSLVLLWFMDVLTLGMGVYLMLLLALGILFLLLGTLVQPLFDGFCIVLLCLVLSYLEVTS